MKASRGQGAGEVGEVGEVREVGEVGEVREGRTEVFSDHYPSK